MKKLFFLILLAMSSSVYAGTCEIWYQSQVRFRLDFMDILAEKHANMNLEDCVTQAQRRLGQRARARTVIRNEVRLLTGSRYKFSDGTLSSRGYLGIGGSH